MKQLKLFTFLSILSALLFSFNIRAYAQPGNMPTAEELANKMKTKLNLTDEQITQIYPIIEEQVEKKKRILEQARGQGRSAMQSMRSQMEEINKETEEKLVNYLTAEQLEQWRKEQENMQSEMRNKRGGSGRSRGFGRPGW